ncbi:MAG: hypothetical protein ACREVN_13100 [Gammaproteobacteria bacterium]
MFSYASAFMSLLLASAAAWPADADESGRFLRATYLLGSDEDFGSRAGIRGREYGLAAGFGDFALGPGRLSAGLDYRYTRYEFRQLESRDWDLHWLRLPLTWQNDLDSYRIHAEVAPGVASSSNRFKEPADYTSDDIHATARLDFITAGSATLRWTAGVAYDRRFGRPLLYPTGGAIFESARGWKLRLVAPDPGIAYEQNPRVHWFASLAPAGHRWHAFNEAAGSVFDFEARAWRATVGGELRVLDELSIRFFAGREFSRHYEFIDDTGKRVDEDAADAGFAGLSIVVPASANGP